jgi:uncharacterized membrane-anchored protein
MRKRTIKKYGDTWIIKLDPADVRDFGLVEGDQVDLDDLQLIREYSRSNSEEEDEPKS